jgi:hypothetical protein
MIRILKVQRALKRAALKDAAVEIIGVAANFAACDAVDG